jgi:hypothetical protein
MLLITYQHQIMNQYHLFSWRIILLFLMISIHSPVIISQTVFFINMIWFFNPLIMTLHLMLLPIDGFFLIMLFSNMI